MELDGNYYVELIRRIEERMAEIDPKFKKGNAMYYGSGPRKY